MKRNNGAFHFRGKRFITFYIASQRYLIWHRAALRSSAPAVSSLRLNEILERIAADFRRQHLTDRRLGSFLLSLEVFAPIENNETGLSQQSSLLLTDKLSRQFLGVLDAFWDSPAVNAVHVHGIVQDNPRHVARPTSAVSHQFFLLF
ncbi:MAG: hypothetical protein HZB70_03500 [Candidatus Berkelbacteria bacterium]|nr:MAG: hypothetical protein HZB70_03500 [Candidatus Berkelbacteria bacterium]QQG51633.1 MAG: hypothetical protein HY845_03690 [Candidatus Berkelbacteria bacterium]